VEYEVEFTEEFERWWDGLAEEEPDSVAARVELLERHGPNLGRPQADVVHSSRRPNMKELRIHHAGSPYRVLFAFDPERDAILLVGGDKMGNDRWYEEFAPVADRLFDERLAALKREEWTDG